MNLTYWKNGGVPQEEWKGEYGKASVLVARWRRWRRSVLPSTKDRDARHAMRNLPPRYPTYGHSKGHKARGRSQGEKKKTPRRYKQLAPRRDHATETRTAKSKALESPPLWSTGRRPPPCAFERGEGGRWKQEEAAEPVQNGICVFSDTFTAFHWYLWAADKGQEAQTMRRL